MRNIYRRLFDCHFVIFLIHLRLGNGIERRGRLVKNNKRCVLIKCAGKHKPLRLSAGKKHRILIYLAVQKRFVSVFQRFDFSAKPRFFNTFSDALGVNVLSSLRHIGSNGSGKERKLLKHRREHFVIIPAVIVSYISPVKEHTPFCGIEKAAYQLDKGRFSRAVQTDHGKLFSGMQSKIYAGESVSFGVGIAI